MASNQLLFALTSTFLKTPKHVFRRQSMQSLRGLSAITHSKVRIAETNQTELQNGIRVATEDIGGATATVGVYIDAGSRYESEQNNGLSNLVIHSLLSGSKTRTKAQFESELQKLGAILTASVERDRTALNVRCLSSDVPKAIEILSDLITNPKFDENDVQNERKTILNEMQELDKNNEIVVMNSLHAMAYQNTPLALPSIGKSDNISSLNRNDLTNYVNTHFKGPRIVFSAAGSVDHNQIVKAVEQHFGQIKSTYDNTEVPILSRCRYTGSDIRIRDDAMPLAHIAFAVEAPGFESPDHWSMALASSLMGSWDRTYGGGTDVSSYLGICSATDNLTHSFRSFNLTYKETGLFGVYLVTERMKQEDVIWHLTHEWKRFCTELTDNELNRAKNSVITELMRQNEGSALLAQQIGNQVLNYGRRIPLDELQSRIVSIDAKKVKEVCNEYIWDRCPVVSAIGPIEQLEDYEILRGKTYWFRY